MNLASIIRPLVAFLPVLLLFSGCLAKKQITVEEPNRQPFSCITVIPTQTPVARSSTISYRQAESLEKGAAFVDALLPEMLQGNNRFRFATHDQLGTSSSKSVDKRMDLLRSVANTQGCNGILITSINKYQQRDGSSFSVNSAASATIQMKIISTSNGRVMWQDLLNETQQPLFSNLLNLEKASRRGFKWITVEELTRSGIEELLESCLYYVK